MTEPVHHQIPAALSGERIDRALAAITGWSRTVAGEFITRGAVKVDQVPVKIRSHKVAEGQRLEIDGQIEVSEAPEADEHIVFDVVWADQDVIVVDKPAGLVVHPGAGNPSGTLVNGLLARFGDLAESRPGDLHRPGIVHRLDAGTSGLLVVARTQSAYETLVAALKAREVERRYLCLLWGALVPDVGMVDAPIGRSGADRTRMAISATGREARTRYEIAGRNDDPSLCLVKAQLDTGRTHQIRVHFAAIGHPVVGDRRYGGVRKGIGLGRPFLHAQTLSFAHPSTGERLSFSSPLPLDLQDILTSFGLSA